MSQYYFGSVLNAKLELQTDTRILNGWSPKRLEIQQRRRLEMSLLYARGAKRLFRIG